MTGRQRMKSSQISEVILEVTEGQHGVASRRQLLAAGVSRHAIDSRVRTGRLITVHPGVYSTLRTTDKCSTLMAAVLSGGPGSLVCRRSAACLWGFGPPNHRPSVLRRFNRKPDAPGDSRSFASGEISIHRTRTLPARDIALKDGIPVTSVARTLLDLAGISGSRLDEFFDAAARSRLLERDREAQASDRRVGSTAGYIPVRSRNEVSEDLPTVSTSGTTHEFEGGGV